MIKPIIQVNIDPEDARGIGLSPINQMDTAGALKDLIKVCIKAQINFHVSFYNIKERTT